MRPKKGQFFLVFTLYCAGVFAEAANLLDVWAVVRAVVRPNVKTEHCSKQWVWVGGGGMCKRV